MKLLRTLLATFMITLSHFWHDEAGEVGFMGGDTPPGDTPPGDTPPGDTPPGDTPPPTVNYPEGLEADLHGNKTLLKFYDTEKGEFNNTQIMKALAHSVKDLGRDKITIPDVDSPPEARREVYQKLGLPEQIDTYEVKNLVPDGMQANDKMFGGFKQKAFDLGILPDQAQGVIDFFNDFVNTEMTEAGAASKADFDADKGALQTKWGTAYDQNNKQAFSALGNFATKEQTDKLKELGILDEPIVAEIFHNIARGLGEDQFKPSAAQTHGLTVEDAEEKIREFWKPGHPFQNSQHPDWNTWNDKYLKLVGITKGRNPAA